MEELVSIITPLYNSEKFIKEAIKSVQNQIYSSWEMIIIDDCSSDNSIQIIEKFVKKDERIRLLSNKTNLGVSASRNHGIKEAKGRFIAFLDADDLWNKEKLSTQIAYILKNNIGFSYTAYKKISENGETRGLITIPETITYNKLLKSNYIGCLTVVYDTTIFPKVSFSNARKSEDYLLWLKMIKKVGYAYGINTPLAKYRVLNSSRSSNKFDAVKFQWMIYYEIEKLGLFKSIYYFINYLFIGYKRYRI